MGYVIVVVVTIGKCRRRIFFIIHPKTKLNFSFRISPYDRRRIEGCLARVPEGFYHKVWNVLWKSPAGLVVQGHFLPQQPTIYNMTMSDLNFALLVEDMLFKITRTEYRQIVVEVSKTFQLTHLFSLKVYSGCFILKNHSCYVSCSRSYKGIRSFVSERCWTWTR